MPQRDADLTATINELRRFAVPWDAAIAIVTAKGEPPPELPARHKLHQLEPDGADATIERLEALRSEGCEYLIVPGPDLPWLDERPELLAYLETTGGLVARQDGACAIFALREPPGERSAPDGLPLPPAGMIRITSGCLRQAMNNPGQLFESYYRSGERGASWIRAALERNGFPIETLDSLLDFGCGCGRVIRHWRSAGPRLHGSDYNPHLVRWCRENLQFAEFEVNGLEPPLPYSSESFDLLYTISIFTHLDEPLQLPWMHELARVVRPGGLLLVTTGGETRARAQLKEENLERFLAGELVVTRAPQSGTNACAVYHPERYLRETLARGLRVLEHARDGAQDVRQDFLLLQKPAPE